MTSEPIQLTRTLRRFDLERLIQLCDAHRVGGHEGIGVTTSHLTLPARGRDVAG
jgi:hypothetical protein